MKETERGFQDAVLELAQRMGWRTYHTFDSRFSHKGFPDIVAVRAPRVLFIELKVQGGTLKPEQAEWLDDLLGCWPSVETYIWTPLQWDVIPTILGRSNITPPEPVVSSRPARGRGVLSPGRRSSRPPGW